MQNIRLFKKRNIYPIGFGGAAISGEGGGYGFGQISKADSISLLRYVFERNVNLFDLAPIYGFSEAEKRVGEAFQKDREKVFLVSKCGVTWHSTKRVNMTNDPTVAQEMLEQSLRDLKSEYIDLYMIHWPDSNVDIRKTVEVLARAKEAGKIRNIGLCNTFEEDLQKASEVARIDVVQGELNLFSNWSRDNLFGKLTEKQISFMAYGTFDKGVITRRVTQDRKYDEADSRSWAPWWKQAKRDHKYVLMDKISEMLKDYNLSEVDLAINYNLSFEPVDCTLCGGRSFQQWEQILAAKEKTVPLDLLKRVKEICES